MLGNFLFGSPTFRLRVSKTSGAIKSGVPTTSGGNRPGTTKPSQSIMLALPLFGSTKTFLYDRSEWAKPAA